MIKCDMCSHDFHKNQLYEVFNKAKKVIPLKTKAVIWGNEMTLPAFVVCSNCIPKVTDDTYRIIDAVIKKEDL